MEIKALAAVVNKSSNSTIPTPVETSMTNAGHENMLFDAVKKGPLMEPVKQNQSASKFGSNTRYLVSNQPFDQFTLGSNPSGQIKTAVDGKENLVTMIGAFDGDLLGAERTERELSLGIPGIAAADTSSTRLPSDLRMAQSIAQQLAPYVASSKDGVIEISVRPEELGRVRMTMTMSENGVSIVLLTERSETADLMRRYIEVLTQEFKEFGYREVSFSFSENFNEQNNEENSSDERANERLPTESDSSESLPTAVKCNSEMDLRL